ncbi:MAG: hypothetical protein Kow0083_11960 [Methylophaga sp.]
MRSKKTGELQLLMEFEADDTALHAFLVAVQAEALIENRWLLQAVTAGLRRLHGHGTTRTGRAQQGQVIDTVLTQRMLITGQSTEQTGYW